MSIASRHNGRSVMILAAWGLCLLSSTMLCTKVHSKNVPSASTDTCGAIEDSLRRHLLLISFEIDYGRTSYLADFTATFGKAEPKEYRDQLDEWIKDNREAISSCLISHRLDSDSLQLLFAYRPEMLIYSTTPSIDTYTRKSLRDRYLRLLSSSSWMLEECAAVLEVKRRY